MLTFLPLIVATAVPFTRLLMNGALGFWKICWMGPENWLAGWVQLWFSMAITKTVLILSPSLLSSARAVKLPNAISIANAASMPGRLTCNIDASTVVRLVANAYLRCLGQKKGIALPVYG